MVAHCSGVSVFMVSAWMAAISAARTAFTARCLANKGFPAKAVLTTTRSNFEPHPSDSSTQATCDTSGRSSRSLPALVQKATAKKAKGQKNNCKAEYVGRVSQTKRL